MADRLAAIERHRDCTCDVCWLVAEVVRLRQGLRSLGLSNPNRDPASDSYCHCDCCYGWDKAVAALEAPHD